MVLRSNSFLDSTRLKRTPVQHHKRRRPEPTKTERIAYIIYAITNQRRTVVGRHPLERMSMLDRIARLHSRDMARRHYFAHITPEGLNPTDRGVATGYNMGGLAENIVMGPDFRNTKRIAVSLMRSWMSSPGHRQNILDSRYTYIGVGVAIRSGSVYATQNFG